MAKEYKEASRQQREQEALYHQNTTITTAEQRVNAYIPQDGVGLPKAYGRWSPMHPTKLGTTCYKYIRKPNPRELEQWFFAPSRCFLPLQSNCICNHILQVIYHSFQFQFTHCFILVSLISHGLSKCIIHRIFINVIVINSLCLYRHDCKFAVEILVCSLGNVLYHVIVFSTIVLCFVFCLCTMFCFPCYFGQNIIHKRQSLTTFVFS